MEAMSRGDQHCFSTELQRCRMNLSACNTPKIKGNCVPTPHPRKKFRLRRAKSSRFSAGRRCAAARPRPLRTARVPRPPPGGGGPNGYAMRRHYFPGNKVGHFSSGGLPYPTMLMRALTKAGVWSVGWVLAAHIAALSCLFDVVSVWPHQLASLSADVADTCQSE